METHKCPYCGITYLVTPGLKDITEVRFGNSHRDELFYVFQHLCPSCDRVSFSGFTTGYQGHFYFSFPPANSMPLPDYIPEAIRQDYLEAVQIRNLSPKAAATLARRCLQGMIHNFWGIKEKNLNAEITALKGKISANQWAAIDGLRKVGNIGAHMEKDVELIVDVDQDEAQRLLKLIELLFKNWYIARYDEEALYQDIQEMADDKEHVRLTGKTDGSGAD